MFNISYGQRAKNVPDIFYDTLLVLICSHFWFFFAKIGRKSVFSSVRVSIRFNTFIGCKIGPDCLSRQKLPLISRTEQFWGVWYDFHAWNWTLLLNQRFFSEIIVMYSIIRRWHSTGYCHPRASPVHVKLQNQYSGLSWQYIIDLCYQQFLSHRWSA